MGIAKDIGSGAVRLPRHRHPEDPGIHARRRRIEFLWATFKAGSEALDLYSGVTAVIRPWSTAMGDGGHPGTTTSTGITALTPPRLA